MMGTTIILNIINLSQHLITSCDEYNYLIFENN